MEQTAATFLLLALFFGSCSGQSAESNKTTYVQQLEYGLNGLVKEVTTYTCIAENDKIPGDTTNYVAKRTITFDRQGNMLAMYRAWRPDRTENSRTRKSDLAMTFFGKGKEISFESNYVFEDGEVEKYRGNYVWSDDYNYTVFNSNDTIYSVITTLDKDFKIIKTTFRKGDIIQSSEALTYHYKKNKLHERINTITENQNEGRTTLMYQVQVPQYYDKYENPTITYGFIDLEKQNLTEVYFTTYKYYAQ